MSQEQKKFYIVGIGASAGGLEALEQFFQALPADNGMAFVVIQHLSPDYKSMMAEILSKYTPMPVREAEDNIKVESNHVYLIPPKKSITIEQGHLRLTEKPRQAGLTLPIDTFFHSLAQDYGEQAIAVVMSGTGSDGTRGIRGIKEKDGMVMVQDRESSRFDGMPQSAINTGLADFILTPEEMPQALINYIRRPSLVKQPLDTPSESSSNRHYVEPIPQILKLIKDYAGVDFNLYKPPTVLRRIERRAGIRQCRNVEEYLELLKSADNERKILYKELLIGVTKFFRNQHAFEALYDNVIPKIFENTPMDGTVRAWIAGCSTGEEAYSLAILLSEYRDRINSPQEIKIFATDIDADALEFAAGGTYPQSTVADVTPKRLINHFTSHDENYYTINPKIRKMVVFAQHDLTSSPPFNKLDLISCRNLFIYLQPQVQERILHLFHFALKSDGFLFLGESENINDSEALFSCLDKHNKLYSTRGSASSLPTRWREMPSLSNLSVLNQNTSQTMAMSKTQPKHMGDYIQKLLLDRFLPPCVLINDNLDVLYVSEGASAYLQIRGVPDYNLARMLPETLSAYARTAVSNALKKRKSLVYKTSMKKTDGSESLINMHVEPLPQKQGGAPLLLMLFEENSVSATESVEAPLSFSDDARQHMQELEKELDYTRETLQATIEELETSNEELQATNEELLAANEELQSTNEELQAVNEELVTVNAEHQHKIGELEELNEAINNLLRCSRVAMLFLDNDLRIRRFTPAIRKEMRLQDSDIGRSIEDIRHRLDYPGLLEDLKNVMQSGENYDLELRGENENTWFWAQLSPYFLDDGNIGGCILNLVDISEHKLNEQRIQDTRERLQLATDAGGIGIWEWHIVDERLEWDDNMFKLYGATQGESAPLYKAWHKHVHPDDVATVEEDSRKALESKASHYHSRFRVRHEDGSVHHIHVRAKIHRDANGKALSMLGVSWDETKEVIDAELFKESERLLNETQYLAGIGGWQFDMRTQQFTWTDACCRIARLNPDDPKVPHSIDDAILFFHPEEREHLRLIAKQMMTEGGEFDIESRFINAQNKQLWLRIKGEALRDGSQITKLRGLMQDITASKQAANRLQAAEQFIHDTIDSLPSHLCVVDERGQILMVNRAWRQFAQENPPSPDNYFEGMNYLEVCDGASGAACEEATPFATGLRQVLDGEVDSFKLLYPCHSPTQQRWFHVNVSRFYENDKVRAVIMHENVTDRVLAEEAIRTLNRDFTTLLESTTDFIYFKDQNSRFRFCSQSMANAGGHQNWENLIGKYEQEVLPPELAKICSADEIDILNQGKPVLNKVQAYNDKEGQQHWLNTSKWPVNDRQNQVVGVFGISRDISDIKQVQMELERARDAAESANRAKSTFLANMSHELRTPLNGILGYTQILQQYEELGKSERESLEVIQRSGEYLLELINDVLDLAKIDAGRLELHIEAIHVKTFFQDIADMFRFRASRRDLIFDFSLKTPMPEYIHSDPIRLRQVIINILGNAMKFTQRGSVSLRVAYEKAELVIAVEDTGPGISAEDREEIFKPFSQSGDQRYKAQGTGLGLSITHKILHLMNAHLALESELGKGSCFTLHIPVDATTFAQTQESEDSKKAEKSEQDDNGASFDNMRISGYRCLNEKNALRILIVDDVADNREVLIRMLHPLGFEIQEASNGEACLSIAQNLPPDLVLMDLRMPKMDGHEATRQLHALEGLENIPIIAVSASAFQQDKEASHEAGCIDYIAKPVKRNTLLKLLQQYLPLEWVTYENEAVEEDDSITLEDSQRDEIADILRRGAITELINYLNELSLTSKYSEQASELFSLAKQIRIEDIRRRLKL